MTCRHRVQHRPVETVAPSDQIGRNATAARCPPVGSRAMASTGRREQPATAKRAAIQAAVLRATEDLLAEGVSYADLGIERIATRAGISRTAFYF